MGIFDRFPYSSTHEMNLDFMLGKATEIAEDMQTVTTGMAQVQAGLSAISEKTEQATQAATQAAASASSIEGSVTAAEEAAEEAQMHNESAQTWANNAMTYKADCQRAASEAAASSSSAAQAATAAAASEDTVATYAQAANASAQSAANNNDSAHQYANQASASASNATFHSSNAQTAATNAQTAATNANTSATNASASADRAATLKTDVETLHRMCTTAVDLAAEQAAAAANSAGQAAATKTEVENLVESLPEDFTDLNNHVNQLSDEIVDVKSAYNTNTQAYELIPNQYIKSDDGSIINYNGWSRTEKIYVKTGEFYLITETANSTYNVFYGDNDNRIDSFTVINGVTSIIIPDNVAYMILSNTTQAMNNLVIKKIIAANLLTKLAIPFEIGNINFIDTNTPPEFRESLTRVRTPENFTLHLKVGDRIGLLSYTDARYWLIYKTSENEYKVISRITKDTVISEEGDYWILLSNITEVSQDGNPNILGSLFFLKSVMTANSIYGFIMDRYNVNKNKIENIIANTEIGLNHVFMKPAKPKMLMHRGLSANAPENTVPAFTLAGQGGAWGIETDVFELTGGDFVCFHDSTVDRMTDGTGDIASMSLSQVEALTIDAGSHIEDYPNLKIPTLEQYLTVCRRYGCVAVIEIKNVTNYDALLTVIEKKGMLSSCMFLAPSESVISYLRTVTDIPIALIGYTSSVYSDLLDIVKRYYNVWLDIASQNVVTDADIITAHENNIPVLTWTTDNSSDVDSLFNNGVDVVTSNSITQAI